MRYKDHILRAMNTDVEHLNLKENMLMNQYFGKFLPEN